jgi:hypothetical protein
MIRIGHVTTFVAFLFAFCSSAGAQQSSLADLQSKLVGSWVATVEGEQRTRSLSIAEVAQKGEGLFVVFGRYSFSDESVNFFKSAEVRASASETVLTVIANAGSVMTVSASQD